MSAVKNVEERLMTPMTELRDTQEIDQKACEEFEDESEDILGQPVTVNATQSGKVTISQQPKAVSGPGDVSRSPDDGPTQPVF